MKKVLYTLGLLGGTIMAAQAQTSAIKLNVTSLAVGTFNGSFEHSLGDKTSFQIGAFYASYGTDPKFKGFGITPELRYYVTGESMQGLFVAPYLRYQNYNLSQSSVNFNTGAATTESATLNTFGGGVNVGYQWIFGEHFVLEPFVRVGYNAGKPKADGNSNVDDFTLGVFTGTSVLPGLNLGFAF